MYFSDRPPRVSPGLRQREVGRSLPQSLFSGPRHAQGWWKPGGWGYSAFGAAPGSVKNWSNFLTWILYTVISPARDLRRNRRGISIQKSSQKLCQARNFATSEHILILTSVRRLITERSPRPCPRSPRPRGARGARAGRNAGRAITEIHSTI